MNSLWFCHFTIEMSTKSLRSLKEGVPDEIYRELTLRYRNALLGSPRMIFKTNINSPGSRMLRGRELYKFPQLESPDLEEDYLSNLPKK